MSVLLLEDRFDFSLTAISSLKLEVNGVFDKLLPIESLDMDYVLIDYWSFTGCLVWLCELPRVVDCETLVLPVFISNGQSEVTEKAFDVYLEELVRIFNKINRVYLVANDSLVVFATWNEFRGWEGQMLDFLGILIHFR